MAAVYNTDYNVISRRFWLVGPCATKLHMDRHMHMCSSQLQRV